MLWYFLSLLGFGTVCNTGRLTSFCSLVKVLSLGERVTWNVYQLAELCGLHIGLYWKLMTFEIWNLQMRNQTQRVQQLTESHTVAGMNHCPKQGNSGFIFEFLIYFSLTCNFPICTHTHTLTHSRTHTHIREGEHLHHPLVRSLYTWNGPSWARVEDGKLARMQWVSHHCCFSRSELAGNWSQEIGQASHFHTNLCLYQVFNW